jgi:hypothetical protein
MVMLVAHSANGAGMRHPLDAHLRGTAALAREFAERFGAGDLAAYLGLVHDVGKADCMWQERLAAVKAAGGRVGIDHKMAGTRAHQLRQVVVAVPFISITEQNADICRRLLDQSGSRRWCSSTTAEWTSTTGPETGRPAGGAGSPRRTGTRRSW